MEKIGVKVVSGTDAAKGIKIIRKYCDHSIGEIKDAITNHKYVYESYTYKLEDDLLIKKMYDELCQNNISAKLFVEDEEIAEEILDNIIESQYIIMEQTREMMDQEAEEP